MSATKKPLPGDPLSEIELKGARQNLVFRAPKFELSFDGRLIHIRNSSGRVQWLHPAGVVMTPKTS